MSTPTQVVFSFDTTGSMSPCLRQVRERIEEAFAPLLKEIADLEIGLCAHGDYCDCGYSYVTKWLPLTKDLFSLTQFVRNTGATGGGDADECYELVLHEARAQDWNPDAKKVLVVIGDANPHAASYHLNDKRLDWRREACELARAGVVIYSIQALNRPGSTRFYQEIADITGGYRLELGQFDDVVELIKAVVYTQQSPDRLAAYEEQIVAEKRMNRSIDRAIGVLKQPRDAKGRFVSTRYAERTDGLVPVDPGRFQVLRVTENQDIKGFVQSNELTFKIGRGFYEFTKREEIQEKKEVVLIDKATGDMFGGSVAREIIGLPFGTRGFVKPSELKYDVFVQSTSVNRKLIKNTRFLYEVDMER